MGMIRACQDTSDFLLAKNIEAMVYCCLIIEGVFSMLRFDRKWRTKITN